MSIMNPTFEYLNNIYMQHHVKQMWSSEVHNLMKTIDELKKTNPDNIISDFCRQSVEHEFCHELTAWKSKLCRLMELAVARRHEYEGSARDRAAQSLVRSRTHASFSLETIRLADIRNMVVFELYKRCNVTLDTYFERYSSPPGTEVQNEMYARIAHGSARGGTAEATQHLWSIVMSMQVLKRFFHISDVLDKRYTMGDVSHALTSIGNMWMHHIRTYSLGDLIWQIFLDVHAFVALQSFVQDGR